MLDADDLWHPEKIARQVAVMNASSTNVGLAYCWAIEIDENDTVIAGWINLQPIHCLTLSGRAYFSLRQIQKGSNEGSRKFPRVEWIMPPPLDYPKRVRQR